VTGIEAIVVLVGMALIVALTWVQSRGKFMFLDNVINNRAQVGQPWKEYKAEGNSPFVWTLLYSLIVFVIIGATGGGFGWLIFQSVSANKMEWSGVDIGSVVGVVALITLFGLVAAYIGVLLKDFVCPLMYQRRLSATEAWRTFLGLHSRNVGRFILYFLWFIVLNIAWTIGLLAIILVTCCLARILMAIPYWVTVLILPMLVFFPGLGPTFLKQFGEDDDLWKGTELDVQH